MEQFDVAIVGAGPTGLACGIELKRRGISTVLFDKGCVVNSIYHYPINLVFFTTPELLEIGDIPMTSLNEKPGRTEALKYYRRVADHYALNVHQYEKVLSIDGQDGSFVVHTETSRREKYSYRGEKGDSCYGLLRYSEPAECAWRSTSKGPPLLQRSAPFLQPRHFDRGREELGSDRCIGIVLDRGARNDGHSRRRDLQQRQILDQAEHREPHQKR